MTGWLANDTPTKTRTVGGRSHCQQARHGRGWPAEPRADSRRPRCRQVSEREIPLRRTKKLHGDQAFVNDLILKERGCMENFVPQLRGEPPAGGGLGPRPACRVSSGGPAECIQARRGRPSANPGARTSPGMTLWPT